MSGLEELKTEVKSVVRGLVISSPAKLTVKQLGSDYRKQEGCPLPYRDLGYTSLESFLYAISDTIYLKEPYNGCPINMYIVEPMQSEKTRHIEKMVMHQNSKPKDKKSTSAQPGSWKMKSKYSQRFLPVVLRTGLCNVCEKYTPQGFPLISLREDLNNYMHEANGWPKGNPSLWLNSHGFNDMEELIECFVQQQLINMTIRNGIEWVIPILRRDISGTLKIVKDDMQDRSTSCNSSETASSASDPYSNCAGLSEVDDEESHSNDLLSKHCVSHKVLICAYMMQNLRSLMKKHPEGLWCSHLPNEYKKLTGSELDYKTLGFVSMIEMVTSLNDIFISKRPDKNSDWLLFDGSNHSSQQISLPREERKFSSIPSYITRNIKILLMASPMGIKRNEFLECYKEKFNEDLPMVDFGFVNITSFIAHLSELGVVKYKRVDGCLLVVDPSVDGAFLEGGCNTRELYPKNVMRLHDTIPVQPLPDGLRCSSKFDIIVTNITNPSFFWYQLWNKDIQGKLDALMLNLQKFYNSQAGHYAMPYRAVKAGLHCAVLHRPDTTHNTWNRACIQSLPSLTEAVVILIDYGTTCKVLRSDICFLHKSFSELPTQSLQGGLFNIRPVNFGRWKMEGGIKPSWSLRPTYVMKALVSNLPIVAVVGKIRERDMFTSVALIDTSTEDDKHVNDILVELKYAEVGQMDDEDVYIYHEDDYDDNDDDCDDYVDDDDKDVNDDDEKKDVDLCFKSVLEDYKAGAKISESSDDEDSVLEFEGTNTNESKNLVVALQASIHDLVNFKVKNRK